MQAPEPREKSRVCKRCMHLSQEKDQGVGKRRWQLNQERDHRAERRWHSEPKEIRGWQETSALEPRKRSGVCKKCRQFSQERDQGVAKM